MKPCPQCGIDRPPSDFLRCGGRCRDCRIAAERRAYLYDPDFLASLLDYRPRREAA